MSQDTPPETGLTARSETESAIPPEAELMRLARHAAGMTVQAAAEASRAIDGKGISAAYWGNVERGEGTSRGQHAEVRASARVLAIMATVTGVTPARLKAAGREDAADLLDEMQRRREAAGARRARHRAPGPDGDDWLPPISAERREQAQPVREEILLRRGRWREQYALAHPGISVDDIPEPPGAELFPDSDEDARTWDGRAGVLSVQERVWLIAALRAREAARGRTADTGLGPSSQLGRKLRSPDHHDAPADTSGLRSGIA
jgi:transcriptional regulator with XRE-family HTH domain